MKLTILALLIFISTLSISAQTSAWQQKSDHPDFYIGIQSGMESFAGLFGVTGDYRIRDNFFIHVGAGLGSWGGKFSAGIRNEKSPGKGIGYGVYISRASGLKNFTTLLETVGGSTEEVNLDLLPGLTLNPVVSYKWITGRGNRFFLEGGYAVPLQSNPWKILDGHTISETSKSVLKILSPGGLSIGLGFQFAL
jgi:hypothetical protein